MKRSTKATLVFVIAVMSILNVRAQRSRDDMESTGVSFGVKAGLNLSNLTEKVSGVKVTYSSVANLTAGGYAIYHLNPSWALQAELLYNGSGAKLSGSGKINMSYLSVPVLAKYAIASSGFSIFAGPQIGFLLSAKSIPDGGSSTDVKSSFKSTDISGVAGADYTFIGGFNISARYQLGLSNIDASGGGTIKNNAINFTVVYAF